MRCDGPNSIACSARTIYDQYDTSMTLSHQQSNQETYFFIQTNMFPCICIIFKESKPCSLVKLHVGVLTMHEILINI